MDLLLEVSFFHRRMDYIDIEKNVWHSLESLETGSVIFERKEGPFVEHEVEEILIAEKKREICSKGSGNSVRSCLSLNVG